MRNSQWECSSGFCPSVCQDWKEFAFIDLLWTRRRSAHVFPSCADTGVRILSRFRQTRILSAPVSPIRNSWNTWEVRLLLAIMGYVGLKRRTLAFISFKLIFLLKEFLLVLNMARLRIKGLIGVMLISFSVCLFYLTLRQSLDRFENDPLLTESSENRWAMLVSVRLIFHRTGRNLNSFFSVCCSVVCFMSNVQWPGRF